MKLEQIKKRLSKKRKMSEVRLRVPADVVEDLKRLAGRMGFSSHQALMRAYVGEGIRHDMERTGGGPVSARVEGLKRRAISKKNIRESMGKTTHR